MKSDLFTYLRAGRRPTAMALIAMMLAMLLLPFAAATAQNMGALPSLGDIQDAAGSPEGADADTSRVILMRLFGSFGHEPFTSVGGADTLLGTLFFTFNAVIFVVGTSYIGYQIVMAIASSAHEGEVLGKRMNSLWAPIRLGVGIFGMLPVFKGFSLAQSVILGTALLGIGMANMMVDKTVESADHFDALIPPPGLVNVAGTANGSITDEIAHNMFTMNVCIRGAQNYMVLYQHLPTFLQWTAPRIEPNSKGVTTHGVWINCGNVLLNDQTENMRRRPNLEEHGFSVDAIARTVGIGGFRTPAVDYDAINAFAEQVVRVRRDTLHALFREVKDMSDVWYDAAARGEIAPYPIDDIDDLMRQLVAAENEEIERLKGSQPINGAFSDGITDRIKEGGWLSIGSWYATFAEQDAAIQSAFVQNSMEIEKPDLAQQKIPPEIQDPLLKVFAAQEKAFSKLDSECYMPGATRNAVGECNYGQGMVLALLGGLNSGGAGMVNPILTAKNIGDWMLTLVGGVKIADFLTSVTPVGQSVKGMAAAKKMKESSIGKSGDYFMGAIGKVGSALMMGFFVLGLVFAVYIPMIPFITWFTAVVSYFASVIEGLVGAQIWAFSHLSSEGEGMGQRTEKGYIYLLNMLLRPGLMVLGFFFAAALMTLMATFMFQQLGTAIANMQGDTQTGPFIILGILFVYMILLITLIQTLCNLIYEIPDRVIAWFGQSMEARLAQNMDRMTEGKMDNATRWAGQTAAMKAVRGGL